VRAAQPAHAPAATPLLPPPAAPPPLPAPAIPTAAQDVPLPPP
jgi:hypothetical protein